MWICRREYKCPSSSQRLIPRRRIRQALPNPRLSGNKNGVSILKHPPSLSTMLKSAPTLKGGRVNGCSVADYDSGESAGIVIPQVATASYRPDQVGLIMRNKD